MAEIDFKERDKKYNLWARKYPAYICLSFLVVVFLFYIGNTRNEALDNVKYIFNTLLSLGTIAPALFFFYTFLIRDIAKMFPEDFLYWEFYKPTTGMLFEQNRSFSENNKKKIKEKINSNYGINLDEIPSGANKKNKKYCQEVNEVVYRIRENTRHSHILFEFNCIYGFYRNLSGGLLLDLIIIIVLLGVNRLFGLNMSVFLGFMGLLLIFLIIICLCFTWKNGIRYAKRLYIVYLDTN